MSDYTPVDAEVFEYYSRCRKASDWFMHSMMFLIVGIIAGAWGDISNAPFALAFGLFNLLFGLFILQYRKAVVKRGYARAFFGYFFDFYYPPLDEWEESLEERGKFAEVELE